MRRRRSIAALIALGLGMGSLPGRAQQRTRERPARIAILEDAPEAVRARFYSAFRKRLTELGYTEGKNLFIEARWAEGDVQRLPGLAAELVALKPDVIVVVPTVAALVAKKATSTIPIVAIAVADPVKSGLVASFARPGGNLTGFSPSSDEIVGKWLELLREIAPQANSLAFLTQLDNPGEMLVFRELEQRAQSLGMKVQALDGINRPKVEKAFAVVECTGVNGLIVAFTSSVLAQRQQIVAEAARLRLPAIYARQEYAEAGGLLAYGTDFEALFLRGAEYVHRILQGTQPSDLPIELASTFRLVLNMKTARTLGVKIPGTVLVRADRVIE